MKVEILEKPEIQGARARLRHVIEDQQFGMLGICEIKIQVAKSSVREKFARLASQKEIQEPQEILE